MSVRTYNPSVRVGNWNEDLCLEEDLLKDFLEKKQNGELSIDKSQQWLTQVLKPTQLSSSNGIKFGDSVCVFNPSLEVTLSINMSTTVNRNTDTLIGPCGVSGSKILNPICRNTFVIKSPTGDKQGQSLMYGEPFLLCSQDGLTGDLKLTSELTTFTKNAKKSRLQEVLLVNESSFDCHWQVLHFNPQLRLETEGTPVPGDQKIMLNHCKTNQRLRAMSDYRIRTAFGHEHEIVAHTDLDSHKAEKSENHWIIVTGNAPSE